jgi:E3 ubiquitin-protein ligase UBR4
MAANTGGQPVTKKSSEPDLITEPWDLDSSCTGAEGCICGIFVQQLHRTVERRLISRLIFRFLLDCNVTAVRWHAHALVHSFCRHSTVTQQQDLVALMWSLWSGLQLYGRKASQFVDLLGYFTIKTPGMENSLPGYVDRAVALLKEENQLIVRHPNTVLYNALASLVHLDGYYLERDPCLACSTLEVPFSAVKLTTLKADVRFTTSTHIIKLVGSHIVNRFALRITDIKRTKMVRTINIYYNNRPVQAAVELKNRPGVWLKAKKLSLTPGQAEVKVDLPLPITCCNLKIEFAAFYENLHASSEMLQCPRCSASVPAHPGVCSNCGENVYQCHKCRSINYDEKDPFLCNACGFCKYAKFELTLSAKPCCTVEPVESEDDRKKSLLAINGFLEKADRLQGQMAYTR